MFTLRTGAVGFFRAYEIFGDKKYLEAGLDRADVILKAQWPKGHWPWGTRLGENFVRIQDGFNNEPFWIMLYAYKLSGDKKFLNLRGVAPMCCFRCNARMAVGRTNGRLTVVHQGILALCTVCHLMITPRIPACK